GAGDADAADVGAAADTVHPAAFGDVAIHHRPPAAQFDEAFGRAVLMREIALLVVGAAITTFVDRFSEEPGGAEIFVERDGRRQARDLIEQIKQRLHHVVGLHRAAGNIYDGKAGLGTPIPAEVIGKAHRAGGIALHGVDAAVGGAGAGGDDRYGPGREAINPGVERDRLAGFGIRADGGPVTFRFDVLVGNGAFDHEHERIELAFGGVEPGFHVVGAIVGGEHAIVQMDLGQSGDRA